ncbi:MAG: multicopper oxidase domain-containing protein [Chloroflexi bacterium]|nr:multicopper oxidase domain-containing protein [Chloroflexota bacterium]
MSEKGKEIPISRRDFLKASAVGAALVGGVGLARLRPDASPAGTLPPTQGGPDHEHGHDPHSPMANMAVGDVDPAVNGFDPSAILTDFDYGVPTTLPNGGTLREYTVVAADKEIEVAPGVKFAAWTYNGRVPGPTIRCREGDRVRVRFINAGSHPHTIHFHGIHPANMDGVFEIVDPGKEFVYEFDAEPFGLHLYHCHTLPLKRHIHKGLYGGFIIDPKVDRPPARELFMMMNGFDTNFDGENEVYAVNTVAFHYAKHPIQIKVNELVRMYLINITEFDPINSIHIHANFFNLYRTGTSLTPDAFTDTAMFAQAERGILEFKYKFPGRYMFHAHVSEFTELGWMGIFEVVE